MDGLNSKLLEKIFNMETVPTTLAGWYAAAAKYDGQWRRAKAIIGKIKESSKNDKPIAPTYTPTKDPNAMDIDRLTTAQHAEHMKKGLCFLCHKPGHRSSDHKKGTIPSPPRNNQGQFVPQKKSGADVYKRIATLMGELDEEEKAIAMTKMEEEGF
jgi:hypothetical protein